MANKYTVLFTQERWQEVNKTNKKLYEQYIRQCKSDMKSPRTIEQYGSDLRMFQCWNLLYNDNMCVLNFKKRHFDDFKFYMLEERGVSSARVNRLMSAIRTMMSFAEDDDDLYENYIRNVAAKVKSVPIKPVKEITFLDDEQVHKLREYLREHGMYKKMFLLDLLYGSGARINEIHQVDYHLSLFAGYTQKVQCKGQVPYNLLLHDRAKESLQLFLENRVHKEAMYLWESEKKFLDRKVSVDQLRTWVREMSSILSEIEGRKIKFTPHSFRHSVIENMGNGTHYLCKQIGRAFTVEEIAIIAHHKSIEMTKSYMKPKDDSMFLELFGIKIA